MNRDGIIGMARNAGIEPQYTRPQNAILKKGYAVSDELKGYKASMENLKRFALLVAAAERKACAQIAQEWDEAHPDTNYGRCIAVLIRGREMLDLP
jgi:hypothetical protein